MGPRGRAGKFSKPTRGGGKHYSREVQPIDGMWRDPDDMPSDEDGSSEDSEEDSEGSSDDGGPGSSQEMTREQRRAAAKARKEAAIAKKQQVAAQPGDLPPTDSEEDEDGDDDDGDLPANPNHTAKSRSQAAKGAVVIEDQKTEATELSRREREAIQAQQAKERYMKLHMEGKTDEARADLERLRLVRERREAEKAQREAEKEEREAREKAKAEARSEREEKLRQAALGKPVPRGGGTPAKKGGKR